LNAPDVSKRHPGVISSIVDVTLTAGTASLVATGVITFSDLIDQYGT
jgi:hypothetical protein